MSSFSVSFKRILSSTFHRPCSNLSSPCHWSAWLVFKWAKGIQPDTRGYKAKPPFGRRKVSTGFTPCPPTKRRSSAMTLPCVMRKINIRFSPQVNTQNTRWMMMAYASRLVPDYRVHHHPPQNHRFELGPTFSVDAFRTGTGHLLWTLPSTHETKCYLTASPDILNRSQVKPSH